MELSRVLHFRIYCSSELHRAIGWSSIQCKCIILIRIRNMFPVFSYETNLIEIDCELMGESFTHLNQMREREWVWQYSRLRLSKYIIASGSKGKSSAEEVIEEDVFEVVEEWASWNTCETLQWRFLRNENRFAAVNWVSCGLLNQLGSRRL